MSVEKYPNLQTQKDYLTWGNWHFIKTLSNFSISLVLVFFFLNFVTI